MTDYYQISIIVPLSQLEINWDSDDDDITRIGEFVHDLYRDRAIVAGRQAIGDCGDENGPGCEGCSIGVHGGPYDYE
jgi:hypothetical protein